MATNLVNTELANQKLAAQKLSPTLIIGLGGSGGDVLLRIRKKFFEKFGGVDEFPIVSFLWFDTDKNYKDVGAKHFAKKVDFSNTEERMLTVQDTGAITGHLDQDPYRHIASWWPTGLNIIPQLDDGAGQYRPYSRLGFYYHYERPDTSVVHAIEGALKIINHPDSIKKVTNSPNLQRLNYAAELDPNKRNVYLVGSLAGGTGSGIFLDTSRLVKKLASDAILVGFFLTSRFFSNPKQRMHANSYAALLELDYYNSHPFQPNWSQYEVFRPLDPPMFNYCYLLDTPNAGHISLGGGSDDHSKIYETIAENIFKDFSQGPFAQAKRSARVNVGQFMGTPFVYPRPSVQQSMGGEQDRAFRQKFNRHYQSFGLASISLPHDRIITACAHKLAADLILYWKGQGAEDANVAAITQDVDHFLPAEAVALNGDSILERLDDAGANAEKSSASGSLLNKIIRSTEQWWDQALALPAAERAEYLDHKVVTFRTENLNPAVPGQADGAMVRIIEQNSEKILDTGTRAVEQACDDRIDKQKLSVASTIGFAEGVAEAIEKQVKLLLDHLTALREKVEWLESEYTSRLQDLRAHAVRHNLDFRKAIILQYDHLRLLEAVAGMGTSSQEKDDEPGLLLALRQRILLETAIQVCNALVARLRGSKNERGEVRGGIISRLRELDRSFDAVAETLRRDAGYFQETYNADLSLVLFQPADVDQKYYARYVKADTVKRISDQVRDKLHLTAASVKDSNFLKQEGGAAQIITQCREAFEAIRRDYHIVDVLFDHFGGTEKSDGQPVIPDLMAAELSRVFRSARYWAEGGNDEARGYVLGAGQEDLLVGVPTTPTELGSVDSTRINRRREELKNFLHGKVDGRIQFKDIPETSEIIFYNEVSGIPLNFYHSMYDLRTAYLQVRAGDSALHLESKDASKFEDILILTSAEAQKMIAAFRCFTQGAIFDQIWVKPGEPRPVFGYTETVRGVESHPRMGDERATIQFLQMRSDVLEKLMQRSQDRYAAIFMDTRSSDAAVADRGRRAFAQIAAIVAKRLEELGAGADQGDWNKLPMYQKMEYIALDELNERIHAEVTWQSFEADRNEAKRGLAQFAQRRIDGRYALQQGQTAGTHL